MVQERQDLGSEIEVYVVYIVDKGYEGDSDEYHYKMVVFDEQEAKQWCEKWNSEWYLHRGDDAYYDKTILKVSEDVYVYKWRESGYGVTGTYSNMG